MARIADTITQAPALLRPGDLGASERRIQVEFGPALTADLCDEFDLNSVEVFTATIQARRWRGDGIVLSGSLRAIATRVSVVGLDVFRETTEAEFERRFRVQPTARLAEPGVFHVDDDDPPDPLPPEGADIIALLREEFALALEPNPRKPGEVFEPDIHAEKSSEDAVRNPFSVLAAVADDTQETP